MPALIEGDGAPYDTPRWPFFVDDEGDICDANGWLVCCPAYSVWPDDKAHAKRLCDLLNSFHPGG